VRRLGARGRREGAGSGRGGGDYARVERDVLERDGLAGEELACGERGLDRGRGRKDVGLERVGLASGACVSQFGRSVVDVCWEGGRDDLLCGGL
jgi:hypothetical protein